MLKSALLATAMLAMAGAAPAKAMTLVSQDVRDGARVPRNQVYADCNGDNVSPELSWAGEPAGTRSFAVTLFDPDAAAGGWWHWIAFGVPPTRHSLPRGAGDPDGTQMPAPAIQGTNDFGGVGYGGPCPPAGDKPHRYQFTVWALDSGKPGFGREVTGGVALAWFERHALAKAVLTPVYGR